MTTSRAATAVAARLVAAAAMVAALSATGIAQHSRLVVSAASTTHAAVEEIAGLYRSATGVTVAVNTAGSSTLARQIVEGAPVAVFLSADDVQMDVVEKAGRLAAGTRTPLLTNQLAIVAPTRASSPLTIALLLEGKVTRLAMGETASVPAGVYGRRWLERAGAWTRLQPKVIPFPTVRAVLSAVEAGRVDAGIVYATDARDSSARLVATLSAKDHAYLNIVHSAAVMAGPAEAEGRRFLQFLQGPAARAVFERRGFGTLER